MIGTYDSQSGTYKRNDITGKYGAVIAENIDNGKGYWNYQRVDIVQYVYGDDNTIVGTEKIGEYVRNYSTFYHTFFPFVKDGKEYALCAPNYSSTSVMELPSCKIIASEIPEFYRRDYSLDEDPDACKSISREEYDRLKAEDKADGREYKYHRAHVYEGFCPTDFYVPPTKYYMSRPYTRDENGYFHTDKNSDRVAEYLCDNDDAKWAFVAGTIWGCEADGWKIQCLDLSRIEEGIVGRKESLGYIVLGRDRLSDAINIDGDLMYVTTVKVFDIENGIRSCN